LVPDALIEIAPEEDLANQEIVRVHFPSVTDFITALSEKIYIKSVFYDRWQSTGEIQRLRDKKIQADKYSPVASDFQAIRSRIYAGGLKIPKMEKARVQDLDVTNPLEVKNNPITHFVLQLKTVRTSGNKVIKPLAGEDDMFRTLVAANALIEKDRKTFLTSTWNFNSRVGLGRTLGVVRRSGSAAVNTVNNSGLHKYAVIKSRSHK
jgi:hypothetical protein